MGTARGNDGKMKSCTKRAMASQQDVQTNQCLSAYFSASVLCLFFTLYLDFLKTSHLSHSSFKTLFIYKILLFFPKVSIIFLIHDCKSEELKIS